MSIPAYLKPSADYLRRNATGRFVFASPDNPDKPIAMSTYRKYYKKALKKIGSENPGGPIGSVIPSQSQKVCKLAAVRMGGCRCLFGDAGDADGPHELIDIFVPRAIPAGIRVGVQNSITEGEVQCCRVNDIVTNVIFAAAGTLGPHYDLTLYTAGVRRVGDMSVRGIVDALCVLHGFGLVSVGDRFFCGVVLPHGDRGFGAWNA